jgi:hypothetical protein
VRPFADFLVEIAGSLPQRADAPDGTIAVALTSVAIAVPIESRIDTGGALLASLPRGRLATGFQLPVGRVSARFAVDEVEP